jgi:UDP-glucuronate 4-epimerase
MTPGPPHTQHALVTGGAGFIGSHLVDSLLADGWEVTVVDNFDPFYPASVKQSNIEAHRNRRGWRLHQLDIAEEGALDALPGDFDVVVHLAAKAGVRPSIANPQAYQRANVAGTQALLEFARSRGVAHFVFASSSSVYGVNPRVPWSEDDHVLEPISPYASTKVSGELLGHVYSKLFGIRFLALRFFTVYGPRQRPDLAIHAFARRMLRGEAIPMYGDGTSSRDYTFVGDVIGGVRAAMAYTGSSYEVINLGNSQTVILREMIAGLERALGVTARIDPRPEQPGDVPRTWARIDKARALLGYNPRMPFDQGLRIFCDWLTSGSRSAAWGSSEAEPRPARQAGRSEAEPH